MGQTANQDQLFYAVNLEDHIPRGHLLRGANRFLDLSTLRNAPSNMKPLALLPLLSACLAMVGCGKSLDTTIARCNDEAARQVVGQVPVNEVGKEHIQQQEQGFFFRCVKSAGFKPNERHADFYAEMIRKNNPSMSTERFLAELNSITRQTMRDPKSDYWVAD